MSFYPNINKNQTFSLYLIVFTIFKNFWQFPNFKEVTFLINYFGIYPQAIIKMLTFGKISKNFGNNWKKFRINENMQNFEKIGGKPKLGTFGQIAKTELKKLQKTDKH